MRIKEGDEWKAVFIISKGSFEPTVMFFGLTNSLATFQAIINKLLRDLINIGKVGSFINNMIVEEILRSMKENDLYMKPEKYKWKVREIDFLEVVVRLEEIKIVKLKLKAVLD